MQASEENLEWIEGRALELAWLPGSPNTQKSLLGWSKYVLKFITDRESGDWLFDRVGDHFLYFPKPIELRQIYTQKWRPADGYDPNGEVAEAGRY